MELHLQIKMNARLYVRDPELSELGKNIIRYGIELIDELGFEDFTFKKLAARIGTTEASIYRYFENKHRLLTYIITWFWTWTEYQLMFNTNNVADSRQKIDILIALIVSRNSGSIATDDFNKDKLYKIVISEGNKAYLTRNVAEDNKDMLFQPYKDLCQKIADIFLEYKPAYKYPHSLASTLIETAHHQLYFKDHLPRLTDFGGKNSNELQAYLSHLVYSALNAEN